MSGSKATTPAAPAPVLSEIQILTGFVVGKAAAERGDPDTARTVFESVGLQRCLDEATDQRDLLVMMYELVAIGLLPESLEGKLPELDAGLSRYQPETE